MPEIRQKKLVVIAGPTAVGKTAVAIKLALHYQTEIVSADSRQFFRELTIGTAKPSVEELQQVRHHFIDSHSISEKYDAAQYGRDAEHKLAELFRHFDTVVMCGGSGLYIRAALDGFDDIPAIDEGVRAHLVSQYNARGLAWLQNQMQEQDPEYYDTIDKHNPHRLIRALEVKMGTGNSISSYQLRRKKDHAFQIIRIGLELPREVLYDRINMRMDEMISAGLFEEAKDLYPFRAHNALQTVGYQEIFGFMDGMYSYDEAVELLKQNTRRYAKRQLTWFRREAGIKWFTPGQVEEMIAFIDESRPEI